MIVEEAYLKFIQKVNKNFTNDNISVDRGRFVLLYNEAQNKFVEWVLEKRNEDDIREIQKLLVFEKKLKEGGKFKEHQSFTTPSDSFGFVNVKAYASNKKCTNKKIFLYEVKGENIEEVLMDAFNKPSFEFREAPYTIGGDAINIYTADFTITNTLLNYYRKPLQIDLIGYTKIDNTQSKSIDPEFSDDIVDRILSIATKDFNINTENLQRFQVDKDRISSET